MLIAYNLAFGDKKANDMHESDISKFVTKKLTLARLAHEDGFKLQEPSMLDLLDTVHENIVLPTSYKIADSYINKILMGTRSKFKKKFDSTEFTVESKTYFPRNFTKHKLITTQEFDLKYASSFFFAPELVKYKFLGHIVNDYLINSYILQGIYSTQEFNMELFKVYDRFRCLRYPNYRMLHMGVDESKQPADLSMLKSLKSIQNAHEEEC